MAVMNCFYSFLFACPLGANWLARYGLAIQAQICVFATNFYRLSLANLYVENPAKFAIIARMLGACSSQ